MQLTAVFLEGPEGVTAFVEELPGTETMAATLDEARTLLQSTVNRVLATQRDLAESLLGLCGRPYRKESLTFDV